MRARAVAALAAIGWLAAAPAQAQDVRITAPAPGVPDVEAQPLTPQESELLGQALLFDPGALTSSKPAPSLSRRGLSAPALDVKATDKPDGSSAVVIKQPLSIDAPAIDSSIGADVNTAAQPSIVYQPRGALPGTSATDAGSAAAWASVGVPNLAAVEARLDPTADRSKIGGKLSHSMPVGRDVAVTLEDSYSMTEIFNPAMAAAPTVSTLAAAAPPAAAAPGPAQVFDNSKSVKFNVLPTGTTFGAGWTSASNDPVTHHTLSAEQKLFGPLRVTTSVTDAGQPTENKSITAGFKLDW
ncbi:MAG TPA: hypothetical protein VFB31_11925 [Pseudolabrys sp.]|nr:hypothetical protein [Pseudolabrys sp.]